MNKFKLIFIVLIYLSIQIVAAGQESLKYYEIIQGDSVVFFFDKQCKYSEKPCAYFFRFTKVDSLGNFYGSFIDMTIDSTIIASGYYLNGTRNGYFKIYYPDGKLRCRGTYLNGSPIGRWDFYYDKELPERTLMVTGSDTLLIQLYSKSGKILVESGNGEFLGPVYGKNNSFTSMDDTLQIIAKGSVQKGKSVGKWTSVYSGVQFCIEEFDDGKLIKGIFPQTALHAEQIYYSEPWSNTFFLGNYLETLEKFYFNKKCSDSINSKKPYRFTIKLRQL